ncbi:MAG: glycosyltransferase family 4 protein [Candidatus Methanoperedens sp.]|nr:glycosyltransferase family 4 protein [Candidatus Methanoperedens sp.]MCZ7370289.1 glycosyltransferase family 4 protein [Candidatus Methanoperedens sp.]
MKKKILVLNDFPIYPPRFGGQFRIYYIYKNLSQRFDITYICFAKNEFVEVELGQNFWEIRIPKSKIHSSVNLLLGKIFGISVDDIIAMFFCNYNKKLNNIVRDRLSDCSIVVASHPYLYTLIKKHAPNKFLIYEAHNVEYLLKKAILGKGFFKRFLYTNVKRVEDELVRKSDLVFAMSADEINKFKEIYHVDESKIYISPNGVDLPSFRTLYKNSKLIKNKIINKPLALFMGSGHPPNSEAAKKIIIELAPKMKEIYFLICGGVCGTFKNKDIDKNVGMTFEVSDEEKFEIYRISDIALNPMVSGSGTNIKMLEYMAAGLPIITTPIGARGLDIKNYRDAIICEVSEFPESIREVLENIELYNKLSLNGQKLVKNKYDWNKIAENMANTIETEISKKRHHFFPITA